MILAALAFARRIPGMLSPRAWLAVGVLILFLGFGAYCAQRAAQGERDRQAARQAQTEARASANREIAASERTLDNAAIVARQKERDDAAQALPDSAPDDRELRRRCRQLRDAGRDLPTCRQFAG